MKRKSSDPKQRKTGGELWRWRNEGQVKRHRVCGEWDRAGVGGGCIF